MVDTLAPVYERAIRHYASGTLLDLGCGKVPLFGVYKDLVTDTICVDWETRGDTSHLDYIVNMNEKIPLSDEQFDTVIATDVLEHVASPEHVFREVARLLRPGGKLIVGVPFLYWIHESPHDYYRYTEFSLAQLCSRASLSVVLLEPYGGAPEVVFDVIGKTLVFDKLGTYVICRCLSQVSALIGDLFLRTRIGRRLSRATARTFPLGYCLVAAKDHVRT